MGIVSEYDVDDDVQTEAEMAAEFAADREREDEHCVSRGARLTFEWEALCASYGMEG